MWLILVTRASSWIIAIVAIAQCLNGQTMQSRSFWGHHNSPCFTQLSESISATALSLLPACSAECSPFEKPMPTGTTSFVRVAEVSRVHTSAQPVFNSPLKGTKGSAGCPFDPVENTHPGGLRVVASSGMILNQFFASVRRRRFWLMFGCPPIPSHPWFI